MELTHLQLWGAMLRTYEGREPEEVFGKTLAVEFKFQENKAYVRAVLDRQRDLRQLERGWVMLDRLPTDWPSFGYRDRVDADGIPSEAIVDLQAARQKPVERPGDELLAQARAQALRWRIEATAGGKR